MTKTIIKAKVRRRIIVTNIANNTFRTHPSLREDNVSTFTSSSHGLPHVIPDPIGDPIAAVQEMAGRAGHDGKNHRPRRQKTQPKTEVRNLAKILFIFAAEK